MKTSFLAIRGPRAAVEGALAADEFSEENRDAVALGIDHTQMYFVIAG